MFEVFSNRHGVGDEPADRGQKDDRGVQDQTAEEGARSGAIQDAAKVVDGSELVAVRF